MERIDLQGVSQTLLIPLTARARDAASARPILGDIRAAELAQRLDADSTHCKMTWMSYYGILARALTMDREVRRWLHRHPGGTVVSIGSGLDTRFDRVDDGKVRWIDVDFPEVIGYREELFAPHPRVRSVAGSMLDRAWTYEVPYDGPLLMMAEGVVMYLTWEEIGTFLHIATTEFAAFDLHLDFVQPLIVGHSRQHDAVRHMQAEFRSGTWRGREITELVPGITQTGYINFTDTMRRIIPGWRKLMIPMLYLLNNRMGMYHYQAAAVHNELRGRWNSRLGETALHAPVYAEMKK